jgi:hypothetical protein
MPPIKLGDLLLKARAITDLQLKSALSEQQKWGGRLGEILVRMNILTEEMLVKALSKQLAIPAVNLETVQGIAPHVRSKVPAQMAKDFAVLPLQLRDDGKTLVIAMAEPQNIEHVDTIRSVARCRIVVQVAGRTQIARAFGRFYEGEADPSDIEGSFKVVDASGNTVIRHEMDVSAPKRNSPPEMSQPVAIPRGSVSQPGVNIPRGSQGSYSQEPKGSSRPEHIDASPAVPSARQVKSPAELLAGIEEAQRREVGALKAMVELLIERGVFTREEYLARLKR